MTIDPLLAGAAFGIGIVVGLTGMGGGALMTPILVMFFNVPPLTAVSSDLMASAVMKPVGSFVHLRRGTVHLGLVKWLCIGSVPGAFSGVLIARALGKGEQVQHVIRIALGVALVLAAAGLIVRAYIRLAEHARERDGRAAPLPPGPPTVTLRPLATIVLGALGGIVVGLTSVGSGSLIIIALMALYPTLKANELVGTDLVQAVPLVASAAIAHIIVKDFELGPEIWTREHTFAWMGRILRQREHIHLVQVERHEPVPTIDLRAEGVHEHRWWTLSELEAAEETLVPRRLPEFLRELLDRGAPPKPVDVGI